MSCHNNTPIAERELAKEINISDSISLAQSWSCEIEMTLTLLPVHYKEIPERQSHIAVDELNRVLSIFSIKDNIRITYVLELTDSYNIHIHSMLQVKKRRSDDPIKLLYDLFRRSKVFGRKTIRQVQYLESYVAYMVKDIENTNKAIRWYPIIRDDFELYISGAEYMIAPKGALEE